MDQPSISTQHGHVHVGMNKLGREPVDGQSAAITARVTLAKDRANQQSERDGNSEGGAREVASSLAATACATDPVDAWMGQRRTSRQATGLR